MQSPQRVLEEVEQMIYRCPDRVKYAMNNFVLTVGVSYIAMHEDALSVAKSIGTVEVFRGKTRRSVPVAADEMQANTFMVLLRAWLRSCPLRWTML